VLARLHQRRDGVVRRTAAGGGRAAADRLAGHRARAVAPRRAHARRRAAGRAGPRDQPPGRSRLSALGATTLSRPTSRTVATAHRRRVVRRSGGVSLSIGRRDPDATDHVAVVRPRLPSHAIPAMTARIASPTTKSSQKYWPAFARRTGVAARGNPPSAKTAWRGTPRRNQPTASRSSASKPAAKPASSPVPRSQKSNATAPPITSQCRSCRPTARNPSFGRSGEPIHAVRTLSRPNTGTSHTQYRGAREGLAGRTTTPPP